MNLRDMDFDKLSGSLQTMVWSWTEWKLFFERSISFSSDSVHVIAGGLILLAGALVLRKPISSRWPWLLVVVLIGLNEFIDLWVERWPGAGLQYGEGAKDVLLTMFLPTVLALSVRLFPRLYQQEPSSRRVQHEELQKRR